MKLQVISEYNVRIGEFGFFEQIDAQCHILASSIVGVGSDPTVMLYVL